MELIAGHNGLERISLSSNSNGRGGAPGGVTDGNRQFGGGGSAGLQGSFGGQVKSSITRLFSKNILSDQIVWFIPLAVFGFITAAIIQEPSTHII